MKTDDRPSGGQIARSRLRRVIGLMAQQTGLVGWEGRRLAGGGGHQQACLGDEPGLLLRIEQRLGQLIPVIDDGLDGQRVGQGAGRRIEKEQDRLVQVQIFHGVTDLFGDPVLVNGLQPAHVSPGHGLHLQVLDR